MNSAVEATRLESVDTSTPSRFQQVFDKQRQASREAPYPSLEQRLERLEKLEALLTNNQDAIADAICEDYGNRSSQETRMLEIFGLISGINYTKKRLKKWMKPQKRHVSMAYFGAKNTVIPQPKGVIGVVTPWNYPLFLALSPCTSALAAGNRCIVKMAANSQTLARLMDQLISNAFDEDVLAVIPGVSATEFTHQPWDHLVFTGSPGTAKTVMETAAKTLTPVTLELGGKSPTIIGEDFDINTAAERMMFGKFLNAGQTCVAPDYVFVPRDKVEAFVEAAKKVVKGRYPSASSKDYTSVIDQKAFNRLSSTLEDARSKGARPVNLLGNDPIDEENRKIPPHVVLDTSDDMVIMQDEIFGPLLPIKAYDNIDDVIRYINANERPLALYLYSDDAKLQEKVIYNTLSGGMCINDSVFHVAQHDMPFGGVGNSGMGHYHGQEGFIEFSKLRPIFKQAKFSGVLAMAPPYGKTFEKMYNMMIKFKL
ncbi:coniferyl aldehyde dehydrogenase [Pseudomaricurvus alkylphenolicus]|uniref:coniferyl aldehyde dehydrogenase n=1 Tax=Pseudomaricurvus alkylphenolicus TaxID=1306991 RepID=UPI00141E6155|nr:coniferyl aldehyde dehydrogenase [Pseudomaricurvus alkylphenolicus]NIB43175.1 coniferyl aldehyde dehydrogenase [Pseudomaricurvus alkylphenolicus]